MRQLEIIRAIDSFNFACEINEMPRMIATLTTPIGLASVNREDVIATELIVKKEIFVNDSKVVIQHH